jgi:ubiquinone/menaquinone biosynthesis C-methylase UbiE
MKPALDAAEFDKFAQDYLATHQQNIAISGETPDYFARYKIEIIRHLWNDAGLVEPRQILDFGSGIGNSLPHLAQHFPTAAITALDVSARSLAIAEGRFPGAARFVCYDGDALPLSERSVDLIFSSCVFHHVDAAEHVGVLAQLRRVLAPGGRMIIFEHNPINPVTRYIVSTCEFDENAVLIPAGVFRARQKAAGFARVERTYTGFFPAALKALRPLERFMGSVPIGAQYYTQAYG